jgi:predicted transcriptional regulator
MVGKITSEQIRAGRALARIEQKELATLTGLSIPSIKRIEARPGAIQAYQRTIDALRSALENAGIIFIDENGEGPGVRLKKEPTPATTPEPA